MNAPSSILSPPCQILKVLLQSSHVFKCHTLTDACFHKSLEAASLFFSEQSFMHYVWGRLTEGFHDFLKVLVAHHLPPPIVVCRHLDRCKGAGGRSATALLSNWRRRERLRGPNPLYTLHLCAHVLPRAKGQGPSDKPFRKMREFARGRGRFHILLLCEQLEQKKKSTWDCLLELMCMSPFMH